MLALYVLGLSLILGSSGRQQPGASSGLTVYRTSTPGQFLVQPAARGSHAEIPQGYPQIAVVVVPRHPGDIFHTATPPRIASEHVVDGFDQGASLYYVQESTRHIFTPQNFAFAHLLPYPPTKKKLYPKQKIHIHQFLKEVIPTTKTAYSEHQAASLRYAQATPPQEEQEVQKLVPQRFTSQAFSIPYIIQSETLTDPNQSQPYQQIIHPSQLIQNQENVQPQQYLDSQTYSGTQGQPVQQRPLQPENTHDSLTYIPVNPVMFQKPLVDDDPPTPKSAIYVTQKTAVKKYQLPQPSAEDDADENVEKAQQLPRKEIRPLQLRQYFPLQQQHYLVPLLPQQQQQPTNLNHDVQNQLQPQIIKYQHIQPLQPEPLKYQVQPQSLFHQPVLIQLRPKKVPPQVLVQQQQQPGVVAYQQLPLQQEAYAEQPRSYQLQSGESLNFAKQPAIRLLLQPQLLAYQHIQPINYRQTRLQQIQPEQLHYEPPQEDSTQQQDLQEEERHEGKQQESQETPQRHSAKYKKSQLRSRKYRPIPARVQPENEDESQNDNHESQADNQEEFRIQYQDGLKSQATTYSGLRYRRPLQTNSRHSSRSKDRAVQIIDEDDEEYK